MTIDRNLKRARAGVLALALVGVFTAPTAKADTIELNTWWGGHGSANVTLKAGGVNYNDGSVLGSALTVSGGAGGFKTYNLTTDPGRTNSFLSWCIDIFHHFSFSVSAPATQQTAFNFFDTHLSATDAARISSDLGKLATNHLADADDKAPPSLTNTQHENAAAFQLAVWEIVNENAGSYGLGAGNFIANSASPSDYISPTAIGKANFWLSELASTTSLYDAQVWGVSNGATGSGMQDVVVFTPVPEPEIYAMLAAGLGLMGFVARRRKQQTAAA